MSTIHNINGDLAAATTNLLPPDMAPVWVSASNQSKKMSGAQIKGEDRKSTRLNSSH